MSTSFYNKLGGHMICKLLKSHFGFTFVVLCSNGEFKIYTEMWCYAECGQKCIPLIQALAQANLSRFHAKQEAYGSYCSPEKYFLLINTLDLTRMLVKRKNKIPPPPPPFLKNDCLFRCFDTCLAWNELVVLEKKIFENCQNISYLLGNRYGPLFENTWIFYIQGCFFFSCIISKNMYMQTALTNTLSYRQT